MTLVLQFENFRKSPHHENIILAEINLCAILSQLNKHKEAYKHAFIALKILDSVEQKGFIINTDDNRQINPNEESSYLKAPRYYELKAITFYNIACEFE